MFKRRFPYINFGRTWEVVSGQEPLETRKIELRVICDTKGDAPSYSATSISTSSKKPTLPRPTPSAPVACCSTFIPPPTPHTYEEVVIGRFTITERTNWSQLESLISTTFKRFLNKTPTYRELCLTPDSIYAWEIPTQIMLEFKSNRDRPEINPLLCLNKEDNRVLIYLKGASQGGSMDGMIFHTQLPRQLLAVPLDQAERTGHVVITGSRFIHHRIEMSFVAKRMGEYLVIKDRGGAADKTEKEREWESHYLASFNACNPEGGMGSKLGLATFMENIQQRIRLQREGCIGGKVVPPPHAIVVENLHVVSPSLKRVVEECNLFKKTYERDVGYLIATYVTPAKGGEDWRALGAVRLDQGINLNDRG